MPRAGPIYTPKAGMGSAGAGMDLRVHGLFLDDRLARDGCPNLASCRDIVLAMRQGFINYELTKRLFLSYGPVDALEIPDAVVNRGIEALAAIDLDGLGSFDEAMERVRVRTAKKGRVNREVERARRKGYLVKRFPFGLHVPDIVEIHHSKPIRNQRPMKATYLRSVEEMGGAPAAPVLLEAHACPHHHWENWGVFEAAPGHRQGAVVTDEKLVGYVTLRHSGNSAWYHRILGHGDHLGHGIMYLLQFEMLRHLLGERPAGLRYLVYHQYRDPRGDNTLFEWKHKVLFEPRWAIYEDDRPWSFADDRPGVPEPVKRRLVEAVMAGDRTALGEGMRELGVPLDQVRRWTRGWLRDSLRFTFDPGEAADRDALSKFAANGFPREALEGVHSARVFTSAEALGIDLLPAIAEAAIPAVEVTVGPGGDVAALRRLYPEAWRFHAAGEELGPGGADLVVCDPAPPYRDIAVLDQALPVLRLARKRLVVGMERTALQRLGQKVDGHVRVNAAETAEAFAALYGLRLANASLSYRHRRGGGCYWLAADVGSA